MSKELKGSVKQSMRQSKLYYYLSQLPEDSLLAFKRYLESPYFNADNVVIRYFDLFVEHLLELGEDVERREFWRLLYPGKPYNANRLRKVGTALQGLLQKFLGQQIFDKDTNAQAVFFFRGLNSHNFDHYFQHNYERELQILTEQRNITDDPFMVRFELEDQYTLFHFRQPLKPQDKGYHQVIDALDRHLLFQKLKYACLARNYDLAIGTQHPYRLLDEVLSYVGNRLKEMPPLVSAYYFVYRGMTEPDETAHYFALKEILTRHARLFVKSQSLELYTFGLNFIIRKLNEGKRELVQEIVDLYEELLKDEIFLDDGLISRQNYKNITTTMCRVGQYDWTEAFLEKFKDKIIGDPGGAAYLYNRAVLEFHRHNFGECGRLLNKFLQEEMLEKDEFYEIGVRRYLCMTFFELGDFELLEFHLNAFRNYLPRNQRISESSKGNYMPFIRLLHRLVKAVSSPEEKKDQMIRKIWSEIHLYPQTEHLAWLRKKVQSLNKE